MNTRSLSRSLTSGLVLLLMLSFVLQPVLAAEKVKPLAPKEGRKLALAFGALAAVGAAALVVVGGLSAPVAIPVALVIAGVGYLAVNSGLKAINVAEKHNQDLDKAAGLIDGTDPTKTTATTGDSGDGTSESGAVTPYGDDPVKIQR